MPGSVRHCKNSNSKEAMAHALQMLHSVYIFISENALYFRGCLPICWVGNYTH